MPKAFIELQPTTEATDELKAELVEFCLKVTTDYKKIAVVEFIDKVSIIHMLQ